LTPEQWRVVIVVYVSALTPLIALPMLRRQNRLPAWVLPLYTAAFIVCATGWELWFTYGWFAGDSVLLRRAPQLNARIPMHLNWILNSLADAGSICMGGLLLLRFAFGRHTDVFRRWHWGAFALLTVWFIGQNALVEMFLYHDQLAEGKALSWAPLAPTGPWLNPTLFRFRDRTITLQGQLPWLLMAPLFYAGSIRYLSTFHPTSATPTDRAAARPGGSTITLIFKNLLFTALVPGTVAVLVPLLLTREHSPTLTGPGAFAALLLFSLGGAIYAWCVWDFAHFGRGTPAPIDAPKRLVVRGLYRFTRNPMYVGVLTLILGWAALMQTAGVVFYAALVGACFHGFIVLYEEPHLESEFGDDYERYKREVRRWLLEPRAFARYSLAAFFITAGAAHFLNTAFFVSIVPPYLPAPRMLVYASGLFELLGGVGVLVSRTRRHAGIGLVALLVAVFPANIHMAVHPEGFVGPSTPLWALYARLPLQAVFVLWVWWASVARAAQSKTN